jgi:hypothetical protein
VELKDFYNNKYKDENAKIDIISLANRPKDRFEMAVMIAKNYKGNYLEIGAASGIFVGGGLQF